MEKQYVSLGSIEVYQVAVTLSRNGWVVYQGLSWQEKKIIGDQFITAIDSIGANIAEGYGRFHHKDRIRFYYYARGSLFEVRHWLLLMRNRHITHQEAFAYWMKTCDHLHEKLNAFIKMTKIKSQK